jgi:hypothetical protein
MVVLLLSWASGMAIAQVTPDKTGNNDRPEVIVDVWVASIPAADSSEVTAPALSREFAVAALRALTSQRQWQQHLANSIRNGYPLAEYWIDYDCDRAADSLELAVLAASTGPDRTALQELTVNYDDLREWSAQIVEANRKVEMAKYYMSPTALDNDALFQKAAKCADFLAPMLASLRLSEDPACR